MENLYIAFIALNLILLIILVRMLLDAKGEIRKMKKLEIIVILALLVVLAIIIAARVELEKEPSLEPVDAEASEPWELPQYAYANERMMTGWKGALANYDIWAYRNVDTSVQTIIYNVNRTLYRATDFNIFGYCGCEICSGAYGEGRPVDSYGNQLVYGATGTLLQSGYSVATDTNLIPHGSNVYIGDRTLKAEDIGPVGHQVNVYWATHGLALEEPDHIATNGGIVYWSDSLFSKGEIAYIEESLSNGDFFNFNAAGKTLEDLYEGDSYANDF